MNHIYYLMYKQKKVLDEWIISRYFSDFCLYTTELYHCYIYIYELGIWEDNTVIIWRKKILYY